MLEGAPLGLRFAQQFDRKLVRRRRHLHIVETLVDRYEDIPQRRHDPFLDVDDWTTLPSADWRWRAGTRCNRCDSIRMVAAERPTAIAAHRVTDEVDAVRIDVERAQRIVD